MISLNGPAPNSELADKLIKNVAIRFDSSHRNKRPTAAYVFSTNSSSSVSVQTDDISLAPNTDVVQELEVIDEEELTTLEEHLDSSIKNAGSWIMVSYLQLDRGSDDDDKEVESRGEEMDEVDSDRDS